MNQFSKYRQLVYDIIGAAMYVHKVLNFGLLEPIYQESLSYELNKRGIANQREAEIEVFYGDYKLEKKYKVDLIAGDVIIELKSAKSILPEYRAQLCNYLRLTKKPIGILINFGEASLRAERWAFDATTNDCFLIDANMNQLEIDDACIEREMARIRLLAEKKKQNVK